MVREAANLDWKVLWTTLGLIFLAELGDKTQLTVMALSASSRAPVAVFAGAVAALTLTSLLAVIVGGVLCQFISAQYIKIGSGALFMLVGALLVSGRI